MTKKHVQSHVRRQRAAAIFIVASFICLAQVPLNMNVITSPWTWATWGCSAVAMFFVLYTPRRNQ